MEKNLERAFAYLSESRPYFIATEDGDQARVRPFGSLYNLDGKLYISTTKEKPVYTQLKTAPKIELAAMGKDGWIRVTAEAVEEEGREARLTLWKSSAAVLGRDPDNMDESMAAFYLQNAKVTITKNGAEPETFTF